MTATSTHESVNRKCISLPYEEVQRELAARSPKPAHKAQPTSMDLERPDLRLPELDRLRGLAPVIEHLQALTAQVWLEKQRRGIESARRVLPHLVFTGRPGTGKTSVAQALGGFLQRIGILAKGHLVSVSRAELIGDHIGETAPMVNKAVDRAQGGILFIDEAYSLLPPDHSSRDFGHEALATLLLRLEADRGRFICILAGYTQEMGRLLDANPGLRSRFPLLIPFPDHDLDSLVCILEDQAAAARFKLSPQAKSAARRHLEAAIASPGFANARTVRNLLEQMRRNHALRLARSQGPLKRQELFLLRHDDVDPADESPAPAITPEPDPQPVITEVHGDQTLASALAGLTGAVHQLARQAQPAPTLLPTNPRLVPAWIGRLASSAALGLAVLLLLYQNPPRWFSALLEAWP